MRGLRFLITLMFGLSLAGCGGGSETGMAKDPPEEYKKAAGYYNKDKPPAKEMPPGYPQPGQSPP